MQKKYLVTISILTIFLSTFIITHAQEKKTEKKENKITEHEDMLKYMEIIAADSSMRKEMMSLIIDKCKGNNNAMMGMGKTMMKNQEMKQVMNKLVKNDTMINSGTITDKKMKDDGMQKDKMKIESTKTIQKPAYDSNQKK